MGFLAPNIKRMESQIDIIGLISTLGHPGQRKRSAAAAALARIATDDDSVFPRLVEALYNTCEKMRSAAADALGTIAEENGAKAVPTDGLRALVNALDDTDGPVRGAAADALWKIAKEKGARRIAELGGIPTLVGLMNERENLKVCTHAARTLGAIARNGGAQRIVEGHGIAALVNAFNDDDELQSAAAYALRDIAEGGEIAAVLKGGGFPVLMEVARYGKWDIGPFTIRILEDMGTGESNELLKEIIEARARDLDRDIWNETMKLISDPTTETFHGSCGDDFLEDENEDSDENESDDPDEREGQVDEKEGVVDGKKGQVDEREGEVDEKEGQEDWKEGEVDEDDRNGGTSGVGEDTGIEENNCARQEENVQTSTCHSSRLVRFMVLSFLCVMLFLVHVMTKPMKWGGIEQRVRTLDSGRCEGGNRQD